MAKDYYDLEYELVGDSKTALEEEQATAKEIYKGFADIIENAKNGIPYPEVDMTRAESLDSYEQYDSLPWMRKQNKPKWNDIEKYEAFYDNKKLYVGHMRTEIGNIFWVEDDLGTTTINIADEPYYFINVNDENYKILYGMWKSATSNKYVKLARHITMENREVIEVNTIIDRGIVDPFLKRVSINNKNNSKVISIQDNQNRIITSTDKGAFIVQCCAGSGKTMIMMHRIQYLKYAMDIHEKEYCILGPNPEYRNFFKRKAKKGFGIEEGTIVSFAEFYRSMAGRSNETDIEIVDESVFSDEFLKRVYSKEFIIDAFDYMCVQVKRQIEQLSKRCSDSCKTRDYHYSMCKLKDSVEDLHKKGIYLNKGDGINNLWECVKQVKKEIVICIDERGWVKSTKSLSIISQETASKFKDELNIMLMNKCKQQIKEEFEIEVSKSYKYYWYLYLQCVVLTKGIGDVPKKCKAVFIDEAQQLSPLELNLIEKVSDGAMLNVFGDINQCIYKQGILSWNQIPYIPVKYELNENFRNTNQIIRYCNDKLGVNVSDVGVDGDEVAEYESVKDIYNGILQDEAVCIVKDEFARKDLEIVLKDYGNTVVDIRTVSEVNGLEFKCAYVFTRDMEKSEKYIAFTRPLLKLSVIKKLPNIFEQIPEIIQDDDETVDEEDA